MPEPMVDLFVKDIRDGIAGTAVKAAFRKCAIEEQSLTSGVERMMRAAGQAHVETGIPITVHTNPHTHSGLVAQKVLAEEGADLTKVVIGHSGDTNDLAYLRALADAGSYLGMDRFGLDVLLPFEQRVNTIAKLAKLGYAERWCWPTTRRVSPTGSRKGNGPRRHLTGTTPTLATTYCPRCARGA
jgi:phosphotriesterase-related protein